MISWLINAIRRRIINPRRAIFRYWDGRRIRGVDPIAAIRDIKADPEYDEDSHPALVDIGDADAIRIMANAIRSAIHCPTFEAGGLTELELLAVYHQFLTYTASLKKSSSQPPTPLPSTESTSPSESPDQTPTDSSSQSDSGSTLHESKCESLAAH
jgi:hypothetical protein